MKKNRIVRILAASALLTLSLAATSFAAVGDSTVDLGVGFATAPSTGVPGASFDTGWGLTVGGGYELMEISAFRGSILQVRGDIGYNKWSKSVDVGGANVDLKLTRIPISAGARVYVPLEAVNNLRLFGEASLELSMDKAETGDVTIPGFGVVPGESSSETNFGLSPAVGLEYAVTPNINVGALLKYHIIDSAYLTGSIGVGYKF
jgi:opacity protein-like surface antigen